MYESRGPEYEMYRRDSLWIIASSHVLLKIVEEKIREISVTFKVIAFLIVEEFLSFRLSLFRYSCQILIYHQ